MSVLIFYIQSTNNNNLLLFECNISMYIICLLNTHDDHMQMLFYHSVLINEYEINIKLCLAFCPKPAYFSACYTPVARYYRRRRVSPS